MAYPIVQTVLGQLDDLPIFWVEQADSIGKAQGPRRTMDGTAALHSGSLASSLGSF